VHPALGLGNLSKWRLAMRRLWRLLPRSPWSKLFTFPVVRHHLIRSRIRAVKAIEVEDSDEDVQWVQFAVGRQCPLTLTRIIASPVKKSKVEPIRYAENKPKLAKRCVDCCYIEPVGDCCCDVGRRKSCRPMMRLQLLKGICPGIMLSLRDNTVCLWI
jgi:hypothetical protein